MPAETNDLKIDVTESASWSRRLSITVPAERVQRTRGRVAERLTRGVRLPGFRKGKLPPRVVEQRFGPSIDQETIDHVIQEAYREALESQGITPISQGRVDDVQYESGAELTFAVEVEVQPEVELARLGGFTASRPGVEVGDAEVDAVLERLRDERGEWTEVEEGTRPDYGDQALVEITAYSESEPAEPHSYQIVLGEGQAIPDVENAILTLAPGESGEFDVTFPEDFPDEERRGQTQRLRIELREARRKVLPEIDDEFARAVGEFEGLEALRARVLADLTQDATERAEADVRRQLVEEVISANPFDTPESMIQRYLDHMLGDPEREAERRKKPLDSEEQARLAELREQFRPQAEWGVKRMLIIERIAAMEGLRATQDEIDQRVEEIAAHRERSPSEIWLQLEKTGQLEVLEREITEEKVFEHLKSQNTIA
jgi:trigger factor